MKVDDVNVDHYISWLRKEYKNIPLTLNQLYNITETYLILIDHDINFNDDNILLANVILSLKIFKYKNGVIIIS